METTFTPLSAALGGILIGLAAVLLLAASGRIAGVSGIVGGLLRGRHPDFSWRLAFVIGLWLGALCYALARGELPRVELDAKWPLLGVAGLLVGFGTAMANGCTSGHGVCGLGRLSPRSFVAVIVFVGCAVATTFVMRHVVGVSP